MKTKRLVLCPLAALAALLLLNTHVLADTETDTVTLPTTIADSTGDVLTLESFNESLGTLEGVTLELDLNTSTTPEIQSFEAGSVGSVASGATVTVDGPNGPSTALTLTYLSPFQVITAVNTIPTPTLGTTVAGTASTGMVPILTGFTSYETLGSSILSFDVDDAGTFDTGTSLVGNIFAGGSTSYGGSLSVTYTYATPEPASWALGLIVVTLFGVLRARAVRA
jgi:hypothetical protein